MKRLSINLAVACAVLLSSQAMATDQLLPSTPTIKQLISALDDHFAKTRTTPQLILALDTKELARDLNRNETYTSLFDPKGLTEESTEVNIDIVSKKLKKVGKAFKRFTSFGTGKQQKIRAKIGKSSLTLKYTRIL